MLQNLKASWKTTAAGIVAGLAIALPQLQTLMDNTPDTMPDWNIVAAGVALMLGLAVSRDGDVSSAKAGAK